MKKKYVLKVLKRNKTGMVAVKVKRRKNGINFYETGLLDVDDISIEEEGCYSKRYNWMYKYSEMVVFRNATEENYKGLDEGGGEN